jgi:CBS domain-containing protein
LRGVASSPIYAARLLRLPLADADGGALGRVEDMVLSAAGRTEAPRVLGFVSTVQRRRIFVGSGRVGSVDAEGVRLRTGSIDVRHFQRRPGELLVTDLLDRRTPDGVVLDLGLEPLPGRLAGWQVGTVVLADRRPRLRRPATKEVRWTAMGALLGAGTVAAEVASLADLHPADVAARVRALPLPRRRQLAEAMEDERLADLLEELPEEEQLRIIEGLDLERAADVLEEMEPDDAADLLGEMPAERRQELLAAMEPEEATPLRRLLTYASSTAGGLMTPEPVVLAPTTTVAEAQARLRQPELPMALAAQVFVARPPTETPTGPYLGSVGFQRLLREAPSTAIGECLDEGPDAAVPPDLPDADVAERLARYDAMAVAVCDDAGRLVGAVTVDDVLDHLLPEDWRSRLTPAARRT